MTKQQTLLDRIKKLAEALILPVVLLIWLLFNEPGLLLWLLFVISVPIGIGFILGQVF